MNNPCAHVRCEVTASVPWTDEEKGRLKELYEQDEDVDSSSGSGSGSGAVSGSSFRLILLDVASFYGHTCGVSTRAGVPLGCSYHLGRAQAADSELLATDADRRHQDAGTGKLTSYCPFCKYTLTTLAIRRARA